MKSCAGSINLLQYTAQPPGFQPPMSLSTSLRSIKSSPRHWETELNASISPCQIRHLGLLDFKGPPLENTAPPSRLGCCLTQTTPVESLNTVLQPRTGTLLHVSGSSGVKSLNSDALKMGASLKA